MDGDAKEEIVKLFIEESGETFGWLEENWDFQFLDNMFAFYDVHGWPLWTMYNDKTMTSKDLAYANSMEMAKAMNEKNDYMTELTATKLFKDDEGNVIGVEAEYYDGTIYQIYADSVIIAAGGYIGSAEMTQKYTGGGLDVDTDMHLLKEDGTPVENVYIVGNDSLGTLNESNKAYVTYGGCAQGWALTSGRLAGANAAAAFAG